MGHASALGFAQVASRAARRGIEALRRRRRDKHAAVEDPAGACESRPHAEVRGQVAVAVLPPAALRPHSGPLVSGLLAWSADSRNRFRLKVRGLVDSGINIWAQCLELLAVEYQREGGRKGIAKC